MSWVAQTRMIATGAISAALMGLAVAQTRPEQTSAGVALDAHCAVPTSEFAAPAPLPTLVRRLEERRPVRILAMGSSPTWSASAARHSYASHLESMLEAVLKTAPVDIIHRGVSGETIATAADRLGMEVSLLRPHLVLWQVGTNEGTQRLPVEQFEVALDATVAALQRKKIDVVLVGLQHTPQYARDDHYLAIREAVKRVAAKHNVLYIRRAQAMEYIEKTKASIMAAGDAEVDLETLAKKCLAEHIAQAVIANTFVRKPTPAN